MVFDIFRSDGVTGSEIQQRGGVGKEKGGVRGDGRRLVNELKLTLALFPSSVMTLLKETSLS